MIYMLILSRIWSKFHIPINIFNPTILTRRTDTPKLHAASVEIVWTLTRAVVDRFSMASGVDVTKWTLQLTCSTKPISSTETSSIFMRTQLCSILMTLAVVAAPLSIQSWCARCTVSCNVVAAVTNITRANSFTVGTIGT